MKISKIFLSALLIVFTSVSCKDDFLDKINTNEINSSSFYTNVEEAVKAVNSVYAGLQRGGLYQNQFQLTLDALSDELSPTNKTVGAGSMNELLAYTFNANTEFIRNFWSDSYTTIARANIVLQNLEKVPAKNEAEEERLQDVAAEARAIRALAYLNLVANFGGVPLRTEENFTETQLAKSEPAQVYELIESDLQFAAATLPAKGEWPGADLGRVTSGFAKGLLGKAYLYQKKYDQAYQVLKEVIDSGKYSLLANRRHLHDGQHENNDESLFEVQFASKLNGGDAAWAVDQNTGWGGNSEGTFRPAQYGTSGKVDHAFYNAIPSPALINSYTPNDPRLEAFFFGPKSTLKLPEGNPDYNPDNSYAPIFALKGYAWKKYQSEDLSVGGFEDFDNGTNYVVLRYADVLLMAAEALIEQGKNLDEAAGYINQVRRAADPGGTILPNRSGSQEALQAFLRQERRVELSGEQQRRIDLVRWGIADDVLGSKFVPNRHELLPIPQNELDANKEMKQNIGY